MSIDSYFKRNNKVINDEAHQNAVPTFRILRINNNNPCHTSNTSPKAADTGASGQLPPIPVMNPTARVGRRGGAGGEGEGKQASTGGTKKARAFMGDELTLLLVLTTLFRQESPLQTMMTKYLQTLCKLREVKQKATRRKRLLWQLLLRRSVMPATPIVLVAVGPCCSQVFATNTPRTFPRAQPFSSRSGFHKQPRRRRQERNSRLTTLWM